MVNLLIGGLLVIHGLITTANGASAVTKPTGPGLALPAWFDWWPGPFGRSWLIDGLGLGAAGSIAGGFVWLASGVLLLGAGLGWLGVPVLRDLWSVLAIGGATVGLVALILYFHPIYLVAIAINVAIVWAVLNRTALPA